MIDLLPVEIWSMIFYFCDLRDYRSLSHCTRQAFKLALSDTALTTYCGRKWNEPCYMQYGFGRLKPRNEEFIVRNVIIKKEPKQGERRSFPDRGPGTYSTAEEERYVYAVSFVKGPIAPIPIDQDSFKYDRCYHYRMRYPYPIPDPERIPLQIVVGHGNYYSYFSLDDGVETIKNGFAWKRVECCFGIFWLFGEHLDGKEVGMWKRYPSRNPKITNEDYYRLPIAEFTVVDGRAEGAFVLRRYPGPLEDNAACLYHEIRGSMKGEGVDGEVTIRRKDGSVEVRTYKNNALCGPYRIMSVEGILQEEGEYNSKTGAEDILQEEGGYRFNASVYVTNDIRKRYRYDPHHAVSIISTHYRYNPDGSLQSKHTFFHGHRHYNTDGCLQSICSIYDRYNPDGTVQSKSTRCPEQYEHTVRTHWKTGEY